MRVRKGYLQDAIVNLMREHKAMSLDQILAGVMHLVPPENALRAHKRLQDKSRANYNRIRRSRREDLGLPFNPHKSHPKPELTLERKQWTGARRLVYDSLRPLMEKGVIKKQTHNDNNPTYILVRHTKHVNRNDATTIVASHPSGR